MNYKERTVLMIGGLSLGGQILLEILSGRNDILHIRPALFEEYYKDSCGIKKEDMIAFLQANTSFELKESIQNCSADVHIYYGQRENSGIIKSAAQIHKMIQGSYITALPELYHGEFSLNRPDDYVREVEKIINGGIR